MGSSGGGWLGQTRLAGVLLWSAALGGCVGGATSKPLPASHPASLEAPTGKRLDRSDALSTTPLLPLEPASEAKQPVHHHGGADAGPAAAAEDSGAPLGDHHQHGEAP